MSWRVWAPISLVSVLFLAVCLLSRQRLPFLPCPYLKTEQGSAEQLPAGLCVCLHAAVRGDPVQPVSYQFDQEPPLPRLPSEMHLSFSSHNSLNDRGCAAVYKKNTPSIYDNFKQLRSNLFRTDITSLEYYQEHIFAAKRTIPMIKQ